MSQMQLICNTSANELNMTFLFITLKDVFPFFFFVSSRCTQL